MSVFFHHNSYWKIQNTCICRVTVIGIRIQDRLPINIRADKATGSCGTRTTNTEFSRRFVRNITIDGFILSLQEKTRRMIKKNCK